MAVALFPVLSIPLKVFHSSSALPILFFVQGKLKKDFEREKAAAAE